MYYFLDRPVASLNHGGRLLVWAMRSWVSAASKRECPARVIASAFGQCGILPGLHPFLHMMALFNRHALDNFVFCSLACDRVSEHEAMILSLITGQSGQTARSIPLTLELLVEEDSVGDLLTALFRLDQALVSANVHPRVGQVH